MQIGKVPKKKKPISIGHFRHRKPFFFADSCTKHSFMFQNTLTLNGFYKIHLLYITGLLIDAFPYKADFLTFFPLFEAVELEDPHSILLEGEGKLQNEKKIVT